MLHKLRKLRLCTITLAIVTLAFGFGGNTVLCFMPDGEVHMERHHAVCAPESGCLDQGETVAMDDDRELNQGQCLDVSLVSGTTDHLQRHLTPCPAPALVPLGSPITLAKIAQPSFRNTPACTPPPQLAFLHSVVLLI